jgi:hypothetical protein
MRPVWPAWYERMTARITLRDLPFAARLVLTCFLCAVGLGYFSALVQLHLQHGSRDGNALPTAADVIERFSGVKKHDPNAPPPASKIESMISGPADSGWGKSNMTPAFFEKSGDKYVRECTERGKAVVDAERHGERLALIAWIRSEPALRKKAYDSDDFRHDAQSISEEFFDKDKKSVAVKSIVDKRCVKCHHDGEQLPDLDDYAKLEPLVTPPSQEILPGGWVRSPKQISIEGLTQSTHAHLLSFAVLFTLTGLTFAFSSYPGWLRVLLGPIVLVTQVLDVSCWWLARIPETGPYFAQAILATGAIVGVGLGLQIILGIFDLYGRKGKAVVLVLLLAFAAGFAYLYNRSIAPALQQERQSARV